MDYVGRAIVAAEYIAARFYYFKLSEHGFSLLAVSVIVKPPSDSVHPQVKVVQRSLLDVSQVEQFDNSVFLAHSQVVLADCQLLEVEALGFVLFEVLVLNGGVSDVQHFQLARSEDEESAIVGRFDVVDPRVAAGVADDLRALLLGEIILENALLALLPKKELVGLIRAE
jgi:hypothetical protein